MISGSINTHGQQTLRWQYVKALFYGPELINYFQLNEERWKHYLQIARGYKLKKIGYRCDVQKHIGDLVAPISN